MHQIVRRTAGATLAVTAAALFAVACGDDDDTPSSSDLKSSAQSALSSAQDKAGSAMEHAGSAMSGATETKIAVAGGEEVSVAGHIYTKYLEVGGEKSPLGAPTGKEQSGPNGGKFQDFTGGTIYWSESGGPHIVWGDIRKAWEADGGANGSLGYPTSDEKDITGGKESDFSNGKITWVDGKTTVVPK